MAMSTTLTAPGGAAQGERKAPRTRAGDPRLRQALGGFILGFVAGAALIRLVGNPLSIKRWDLLPLLWGLAAGILVLSRLRWIPWAAAAVVAGTWTVVSYTPLMAHVIPGLLRQDSLPRLEAVVVLSSDIQRDGDLTVQAQQRLIHGFGLVRQGFGKRLVLTRLPRKLSYVPAVEKQCRELGISLPVEETAEVNNTHDEALQIRELARRRGWPAVILVSDPTHMRRAAATFEKAGVKVYCSPCVEEAYDVDDLTKPGDRLDAFRSWFHEVIGYEVYRMRGWI